MWLRARFPGHPLFPYSGLSRRPSTETVLLSPSRRMRGALARRISGTEFQSCRSNPSLPPVAFEILLQPGPPKGDFKMTYRPPLEWLQPVKMSRIIAHRSAGAYQASEHDKEHYHFEPFRRCAVAVRIWSCQGWAPRRSRAKAMTHRLTSRIPASSSPNFRPPAAIGAQVGVSQSPDSRPEPSRNTKPRSAAASRAPLGCRAGRGRRTAAFRRRCGLPQDLLCVASGGTPVCRMSFTRIEWRQKERKPDDKY